MRQPAPSAIDDEHRFRRQHDPVERVPSIDVEHLLQWAVQRTGKLPWSRDGEGDLSFDHGLTAKLRRRPKIGWATAQVTAGLWRAGRPLSASVTPHGDIAVVIDAIKHLPPAIAAMVLACARSGIRPDWMPGVEPKMVQKHLYKRRHGKRRGRHVPHLVMVWDIEPATVRAARDAYAQWHQALTAMAVVLPASLSRWQVRGIGAPASPWND